MSLTPINKAAYEIFSKMDEDEAKLILSALVYETLPSYIEEQTPLIQKHVDAWISKRFNAYESYLKRQYVARVQKNQDTTDLEQAYEAISKAEYYDPMNTPRGGDPENRGRFSTSWGPGANMAGPTGRQTSRNMTINFTRPTNAKPVRNPGDAGLPIGLDPNGKNAEQMAYLQAAYMQLRNQLTEYDRAGLGGDVKVELHGRRGTKIIAGTDIEDAFNEIAGELTIPKTPQSPKKKQQTAIAASKRIPTSATISIPQATVGGAYFDAISSIPGMDQRPDLTLNAMGAGYQLPNNIKDKGEFSQQWFNDDYALSANEPRFRRLKAGAELVDTFVPASAAHTKMALEGAKYVGELGPSAEKIIGPTARKLTYRSRGTERKAVDPALLEAVTPPNKWAGKIDGRSGKLIEATGFDRERSIIGMGQAGVRRGEIKYTGSPGLIPQYFMAKLPNKDYWELQRKSGAVPPSEGVVIDAAGQIVSQSVGFKDDHYLPFNLKALAKLRGGEYVRTRSVGGPTTEDVYTALVSGSNAFTVVSRSGTFTVEFDDSFSGRRRYNDKAGKMVERYGKLLDAAGSGEVTLNQIDPVRAQEIEQTARSEFASNPAGYERRKKELLEREKVMPTPSQANEHELKREIRQTLKEEIANGTTPFAREYADSNEAYVKNAAANRRLANEYGGEYSEPDPRDRERILAEIVEAEVNTRYPEAEKKAMAARSYKAMQLDGLGYHAALQSLQEQYPYYIKRVVWHPVGDEIGGRDKGYVKPKFLRPDDVWEGYFDPDIMGDSTKGAGESLTSSMARHTTHGKVRASGTNYQNYSQMKRDYESDTVGEKTKTPEKAKEKASAGAPPQKGQEGAPAHKRPSRADNAMIEAFKAAKELKMRVNTPGGDVVQQILFSDPSIKAKMPVFARPNLHSPGMQDVALREVFNNESDKKGLMADLEALYAVVANDPGWVAGNPEAHKKFIEAVEIARLGQKAPALPAIDGREAAINAPLGRFSFPQIDAIGDDVAKLNDLFTTLKVVSDEIQQTPGDKLEEQIANYIMKQKDVVNNTSVAPGEPEPSVVSEAYDKAVTAHIFRAATEKWFDLNAKQIPVGAQWFSGGPSAGSTTIHQKAIT